MCFLAHIAEAERTAVGFPLFVGVGAVVATILLVSFMPTLVAFVVASGFAIVLGVTGVGLCFTLLASDSITNAVTFFHVVKALDHVLEGLFLLI